MRGRKGDGFFPVLAALSLFAILVSGVAGPRTEGPTLFPPLFLVRGPEAQYLNATTPAKGAPAAGVSISAIFPFPPKEYVPLVGSLELSAWLSPEGSGERTQVEMTIVNSASRDETDIYLMEFEVPGLLPGRPPETEKGAPRLL